MQRLCVFAHYDRDGTVDDYVFYYLDNLRKVCDRIVFVTTADLDDVARIRLKARCDSIIVRANEGYDFMSWRVGLSNESLDCYDEVVLCNDSVYGPLFPLKYVFQSMSVVSCDFWGMTESHQISYHLQSYFLVFRKSVLISPVFQTFWSHMTIQETKAAIIGMYEVGLSRILLEAGFRAGVYVRYHPSLLKRFCSIDNMRRACSKIRQSFFGEPIRVLWPSIPARILEILKSIFKRENCNVTHFFWKELIIRRRMPFLKVELLRDNPLRIKINNFEHVLVSHSDYDIAYIRSHLKRVKKSKTGLGDNQHK